MIELIVIVIIAVLIGIVVGILTTERWRHSQKGE